MNAKISSLILFSLICGSPLCAEADFSAATNPAVAGLDFTSQVDQSTSAPVQVARTTSNSPPVTNFPSQIISAPPAFFGGEKPLPATNEIFASAGLRAAPGVVHSDESPIWIALAGVSIISLAAIFFAARAARPLPATSAVPARVDPSGALAPNLLPVISQAIKEALVQELAVQRRELLAAQQNATEELTQLARRLEIVQVPLLERLGGRSSANFSHEIPVKIFCACGQKFSFDVQPVDGRMPFPVACPVCRQDGTSQANHFLARIFNGQPQPLPAPILAPQLVDALKQAVVKELAATRAESPPAVHFAVVPENKNGSAENQRDNFGADLLTEGQSLADAGELDKALKCFDTALVLWPECPEALVKMGAVLDKLGRPDEALEFYDRAIAVDESLTIAYLNKGGLFNRLARYDEALRCYEQALHKQKKSAA